MHSIQLKTILFILIAGLLTACGGGGGGSTTTSTTTTVQNQVGSTIVTVTVKDTSGSDQTSVPVTFGQVFPEGAVKASTNLGVRLSGSGQILPSQVIKKATHADGSLRHAIISTRIPSLAANSSQVLEIIVVDTPSSTTPLTVSGLIGSGFDGNVSINLSSETYSASMKTLLQSATPKTWIQGPVATEWMVSAPLAKADGTKHPHLTARFNVRAYSGYDSVRVDVVIENDWAYVAAPQNYVYDATVTLCGKTVYNVSALTHYHQARWRKTFWCGKQPSISIKHDVAYLLDSKAIPNYDRSLTIPESSLASMASSWSGSKIEPMGAGAANTYMPGTGARPDIGLLPRWTVRYILSQDQRAKDVMLGTDNLAGSWPIHYRNKNTDLPVTTADYPYMTLLGSTSDTYNSTTGKYESFPACGGDCTTPFSPDASHQPSFAYVSYIVTGDQYYLEELQFWTDYNIFRSNPYKREHEKGLFYWAQVRGQAWSMRTLGNAAYITPDDSPLKTYYSSILKNNIDWYNNTYIDNTSNSYSNNLGAIQNGYAYIYDRSSTYTSNLLGLAPWQDDFFTASIGHLTDLNIPNALKLLTWKAKFPVSRMVDTNFCWIVASNYSLILRDDLSTPVTFTNWNQVYSANNGHYNAPSVNASITSYSCGSQEMATALHLNLGEMVGYPTSTTGYPSNLQPALAVSARTDITGGIAAWSKFISRSVKPDYSTDPTFAIVPRN